jgi:NAD(P)-dependent dehydrogenase (short-subunit alcohol dehydrogenase family)
MSITNTRAFVSGANRGIGKAIVEELLKQGASKIYAAARNVDTIETSDPRVIPIQLDVTDATSVRAAIADANDINLLINNAGVLSFGDVLSASESEWHQAMQVNFLGKLTLSCEAAPKLEANKGSLINMLTLLSLASMPGMAAYNASKAAAWSMALSLRATLKPKGISVHNVFPGAVDTDMLAAVEMPKTDPSEVARAVVEGWKKGEEDIFPDPMSQQVYSAWRENHKAVEQQFASM